MGPFNIFVHYPRAFCQGFCFYDSSTILESSGLYGRSFMVKYPLTPTSVPPTPPSPAVVVSVAPKFFAEGLCIVPETQEICQLTWKERVMLIYDAPSLKLKKSVPMIQKEGWGISYVASRSQLLTSDGTKVLRYVNPNTFSLTTSFTLPVSKVNEVEAFREHYVLANLFGKNQILTLDERMNYRIVKESSLPPRLVMPEQARNPNQVLNGIAYHIEEDAVYLTGKFWQNIYRFEATEFI